MWRGDELSPRLQRCAGFRHQVALEKIDNEGEDILLDRIIATKTPGRCIGKELCFKKPYARLLAAIDAPAAQQPLLLREPRHDPFILPPATRRTTRKGEDDIDEQDLDIADNTANGEAVER